MNTITGGNVDTTTGTLATSGLSFVVCLPVTVLVFVLRLHTKLVYRLALYQVLSSLALATVTMFQLVFVNYDPSNEHYNRFCSAVGWLVLYSQWMKLMFTVWVTFHLFSFAVLHRNFKRLELLYVVSSLAVPAVMAAVPLITQSYGIVDGTVCYIYGNNSGARVERFALWDVPALTLLLIAFTVMVVMVIRLSHYVCLERRRGYGPLVAGDEHLRAIRQLLPLTAFPLLSLVFEVPVLVAHVYAFRDPSVSRQVLMAAIVSTSLWSTSSGATLLVHICTAKLLRRGWERGRAKALRTTTYLVEKERSAREHYVNESSETRYSLPSISTT